MKLKFLCLIVGLLCLMACTGGDSGDFVRKLLLQEPEITTLELVQWADGQPADTVLLAETTGKLWRVNNGRTLNSSRFDSWWQMLSVLEVRPLYLDDLSRPGIKKILKDAGLQITARAGEQVLESFRLYYFSNIGAVALSGDDTYLLTLPYDHAGVMDYCSATPDFWQDKSVLTYRPQDMDTIIVRHFPDTSASFVAFRTDTLWELAPARAAAVMPISKAALDNYLFYFRDVTADSMLSPGASLLELTADSTHLQHILHIAGHAKANTTLRFYGIPQPSGKGYDTDKCLIYIEESGEMALASWVRFDILLKKYKDFVDKNKGGTSEKSLK